MCPIKAGDTIRRGERWGMIKFGSTTELIVPFPEDAEARVKVGDKVRGGVTILARIGQAASPKPQSVPSS